MSILDILAKQGVIESKDISAIREKSDDSEKNIEERLLSLGVSEDDILKAKSEYYVIPIREVDLSLVTSKVLDYIPEEAAVYYRTVPIGVKDGALEVGITDPDNISARDALNFISSKVNLPFKTYLISESDFDKVLNLYKGLSGEVTKALSELEVEFVAGAKEENEDDKKIKKRVTDETEEENDLNILGKQRRQNY